MKELLRGVIDYEDGSASRDSLQVNWRRLEDTPNLKWLNPIDERLFLWLKEFQIQNNDVPSAVVMESFFTRAEDTEATERLVDIRKAAVHVHGNYAHVLKEYLSRTQTAEVLNVFKQAAEVALKGLVVEENGKKTKLQGGNAALDFVLKKGTPLYQTGTGSPWANAVEKPPAYWFDSPPPAREWLLKDNRTGEGVFPTGKVGMLAAAGGAGKTMSVVQLAIAVATGTPWLDVFDTKQGRVLMVLGEEDKEEVRRRVYRASRDGEIVPPEDSISFLALAGVCAPFHQEREEAAFLLWLRDYLRRTGPYGLVIVDPASRFAGEDAEKDNSAGTQFCQALESLSEPGGQASVMVAHHSNKISREKGAIVDVSSARGSSSLTDGVRWVATMKREDIEGTDSVVTFNVAKSNYAMRPPPVLLRYGDGGVLVRLQPQEQEAAEQARQEAAPSAKRARTRQEEKAARNTADDDAVVTIVREDPGINARALRGRLQSVISCGVTRATDAIERTVANGRVRRAASGGAMSFFLGSEANGSGTMSKDEMEEFLSNAL